MMIMKVRIYSEPTELESSAGENRRHETMDYWVSFDSTRTDQQRKQNRLFLPPLPLYAYV